MQLVVPRWGNALAFKISFIQIRSPIPTPTWWSWSSSCLTQQMASFHSTPPCLEKWKNKWASDMRDQRTSKAYIRYATRLKRADKKKALNNLLSNFRADKFAFEEKFSKTERWDEDQADNSDIGSKKHQSMSSAQRRAIRSHYKKMKRKRMRENFDEDFEEFSSRAFRLKFGNRRYTWSFDESWEEFRSQDSTTGFKWRENLNGTFSRNKKWANESDAESDNESYCVGSSSDRTLLGLPMRGPLKIEDVKNAFRLSALKWHPDKHQGSGKAVAEEKFKSCVTAYKSLCSVLSPA